jgi:hypothetical protein
MLTREFFAGAREICGRRGNSMGWIDWQAATFEQKGTHRILDRISGLTGLGNQQAIAFLVLSF